MPPRRKRSDSAAAAIEAFRKDAPDVAWPAEEITPMRGEADRKHAERLFAKILRMRASGDWLPFDIVAAAELATVTVHLDKVMRTIDRTGWVTQNDKGHLSRTPLLDAVTHLSQRRLALARALGIVTREDPRTVRNNADLRDRTKVPDGSPLDALLARPN